MNGSLFLNLAKSVFRMAYNLAVRARTNANNAASLFEKRAAEAELAAHTHYTLAKEADRFISKLEGLI